MAISRKLPGSDQTRDKALTQAKVKNDSIPVANQFLTAPTKTRLNASQPLFRVAMQNRGNALAAQAGATIQTLNISATKLTLINFVTMRNNSRDMLIYHREKVKRKTVLMLKT